MTLPFLLCAALAPSPQTGVDASTQVPPPITRAQLAAPPPSFAVGPSPRRAILLTGYWPPSNEAVRRFSPSPTQNPQGWIGSNWEGRGYDVYAYFPEFSPATCTSCGPGMGDLMVDYQDTSADFWTIANALQPIAIVTFSRTNAASSWEAEMNSYNSATWVADYVAPTQPTPAPPDASVPAGTLRTSTLPMVEIVTDVLEANLGLNAFICQSQSAGNFVSGFMAYHGCWYQSLHTQPSDPAWCVAAGHVHVGSGLSWDTARRAAEVTLRTVIRHVDRTIDPTCFDVDLYCPTTGNSVGPGAWVSPTGSTSISANSLRFVVSGAVPFAQGLFVYGPGSAQVAWGNGLRCVAAPFMRLGPIQTTNVDGGLDWALDLSLPPLAGGAFGVTPGSTWNFQFAFRDPFAGGAAFDTSNAVRVVFCP